MRPSFITKFFEKRISSDYLLWITEHFFGYGKIRPILEEKRRNQKISFSDPTHLSPLRIEEIDVTAMEKGNAGLDFSKPFVIRQGLRGHTLFGELSFSFFLEHFADLKQPTYKKNHELKDPEFLEIKDVIKSIQTNMDAKNILFGGFFDQHPEYREKLYQHPLFQSDFYKRGVKKFNELFVSSKGSFTRLHVEACHSVAFQFQGAKKWTIIDSRFSSRLRPLATRTPYIYAGDEFLWPHGKDLLKNMAPAEITLYPGDVLFVPNYTWHHVETVEDSVSVSCRWTNYTNHLTNPMLFAALLTATNQGLLHHLLGRADIHPK